MDALIVIIAMTVYPLMVFGVGYATIDYIKKARAKHKEERYISDLVKQLKKQFKEME